MSLATFKKKSVIIYGANVSGKPPGGRWIPRGPFGLSNTTNSVMLTDSTYVGPVGFSLNGTHRSSGAVGGNMSFSKNGTKFRGVHAIGWGGHIGQYYNKNPVMNDTPNYTVKLQIPDKVYQSTLSTYGMLRKRFKWAYNGQYPNNWVQPNYTGNLTDTASQGMYTQTKSASNICVTNINDPEKYAGYIKCNSGTCKSVAPYTKELYIPQTSSQQTLKIQRGCANPTYAQKPFPFATNGDACNSGETYTAPPEWYISEK
jgi:hypothetical protein